MICKICQKDHSVKGKGELSVCELREYLNKGSKSTSQGHTKWPWAFGTGNRFQFQGAK